jgi:glyoxylase-like metal-dependent hydrolase (beta-lactamase superfamily II)
LGESSASTDRLSGGHTLESISILLFDLSKDPAKPYGVLTGDALFMGDAGRPDLRASLGWTANDLGACLYESLHRKLLTLPDDTLVYPAHGDGIKADVVATRKSSHWPDDSWGH